MRHSTILTALLVLAGASVGCGGADGGSGTTPDSLEPVAQAEFSEVDRDDDDHLTSEEFYRATASFYDEIDMDQDGRLTHRELSDGLYRIFDTDRSGRLDPGELEGGIVAWFPSGVDARFDTWDRDANGEVDRAEFSRGLERVRAFHRFDDDGNGLVTDLELADTIFESWDADGDETIDALEWHWD
ncbi:MAG TPA: hypothetical protein RMH99_08355 [Sandaracinaceae bacterium LLY-WYZ-13_1]|nr:hypothetical protein [Sandaracinaceae bacterium LLY-WYZ-13_1]